MKKQFRGNELKALREKYNITQTATAEMLGLEYRTYLNWEYDNTPVSGLSWAGVLQKFEALDA